MKSLDQIASHGIAINNTNTPGDSNYHYVISQPGSYYLTGNLVVTKANGIHVTVAGVAIDLNGFQISTSNSPPGNGITIEVAADRCIVKNGSLTGFYYGVISLEDFNFNYPRGGAFVHLSVSNSVIALQGGKAWLVEDCSVHDNTAVPGLGITVEEGSVVKDCIASHNGAGIAAQAGSTLINCALYSNITYGIGVSDHCTLINCIVFGDPNSNPGFAGIGAGSACVLVNCASARSGIGISVSSGSTVTGCTAQGNKGDGIKLTSDCYLSNNNSTGNCIGGSGGAGIHATGNRNRIEGNHAADNSNDGILVDQSARNNIVVHNTSSGNANYQYRIPGINSTDNGDGTCCTGDNAIGQLVGGNTGVGATSVSPLANLYN